VPAPERTLSAFSHVAELERLRIWDGVVGRAVRGEHAALVAIELDPNADVPEHHHVHEQTGILLRGSLRFRVGAEERELRPGAMWVIPADVPHEVHAGPDGAFLVELFAPPRDDWAGLDRAEPAPLRGF
jgi:quercetin dioxygenase-like cupin family protein